MYLHVYVNEKLILFCGYVFGIVHTWKSKRNLRILVLSQCGFRESNSGPQAFWISYAPDEPSHWLLVLTDWSEPLSQRPMERIIDRS